MFRKLCVLSAALVSFTFFGEAQAATVSCGNASVTETASTISDCVSPNINESSPIVFNGMTFQLGISDSGAPTSGSPLSWATDPMSQTGGAGLANWAINLASNWVGIVVLELKQGTTAGLFDVTDSCDFATNTCSGTWSSVSNGGAINGLSHSRAWYKTTGGGGGVVPLPAAGWMLVSGMVGLGVLRRRKRKA